MTDILKKSVSELLILLKESLMNIKSEDILLSITNATEFFEEIAKLPNIFITFDDSQEILNILLEILKFQHNVVCGKF